MTYQSGNTVQCLLREKTEIRKKLEALHGVTMMEYEWEFLNDQRKNREMYCEDFVDKKWKKTME